MDYEIQTPIHAKRIYQHCGIKNKINDKSTSPIQRPPTDPPVSTGKSRIDLLPDNHSFRAKGISRILRVTPYL